MPDEQHPKPRIYASLIVCESVIREGEANLLSAIRIANGFTRQPYRFVPHRPDGSMDEEAAQLFYPPFPVHLISNFHSEQPAEFNVTFRAIRPNGKAMDLSKDSVHCQIPEGGDTHTLNISVAMQAQEAGLYWFEVYVDDRLASRAPLRITLGSGDFEQDSGRGESARDLEGQA